MSLRLSAVVLPLVALFAACGGAQQECQTLFSAGNAAADAYLGVVDAVRDPDEAKFSAARAKLDEKLQALAAVPSSSDALKVEVARSFRRDLQQHTTVLVDHLVKERPSLLADPNKQLSWGPVDGPVSSASQSLGVRTKVPQRCE